MHCLISYLICSAQIAIKGFKVESHESHLHSVGASTVAHTLSLRRAAFKCTLFLLTFIDKFLRVVNNKEKRQECIVTGRYGSVLWCEMRSLPWWGSRCRSSLQLSRFQSRLTVLLVLREVPRVWAFLLTSHMCGRPDALKCFISRAALPVAAFCIIRKQEAAR